MAGKLRLAKNAPERIRLLIDDDLERVAELVLLELTTRRGTVRERPLVGFSDDDYNHHFRSLYRSEPFPSVSGETVTVEDVLEPAVPDGNDLPDDQYAEHFAAMYGGVDAAP